MDIGNALARFRKYVNATQKEIAEKTGILPPVYSRYEQGVNTPSAAFIIKLADAYGVSTDYLLGRSEIPNYKKAAELYSAFRDFEEKLKSINQSEYTHV